MACHGVLLNWGTHCHYSDIMRICGPTHRVGSEALNGTPVLGRKPSVYSIMLDVDAICVCSSDETVLSTRRHPAQPVSVLILHPRDIDARSVVTELCMRCCMFFFKFTRHPSCETEISCTKKLVCTSCVRLHPVPGTRCG